MSSRASVHFRERSREQEEAFRTLYESAKLTEDVKLQSVAIIAKVSANMYSALADLADYLQAGEQADADLARRARYVEANSTLRKTFAKGAATGDYSDFDRFVDSLVIHGERELGDDTEAEGGS